MTRVFPRADKFLQNSMDSLQSVSCLKQGYKARLLQALVSVKPPEPQLLPSPPTYVGHWRLQ
jgi:hypothetical protein